MGVRVGKRKSGALREVCKKTFASALSATLVAAFMLPGAGTFPTTAEAAEGQLSGSGTEADPYVISNAGDLATLAKKVNAGTSYVGQTVVLANDIDLAGVSSYTSIGTNGNFFEGTFDGKGHCIKSLNIKVTGRTSNTNKGIFGGIKNATIENLVVQGTVSSTGASIGGVIGQDKGGSTITRVGNEAAVSGVGGPSAGIGGIVGTAAANTTISKCYNKGDVVSEGAGNYGNYGNYGYGKAGGIVGYADAKTTITSCYNMGRVSAPKVTGANNTYYGGITGQGGSIKNSINIGAVPANETTANTAAMMSYYGAISGSRMVEPAFTVDANYYLETSCAQAAGRNFQGAGTAKLISKTAAEMASASLVSTLNGGAYVGTWMSGGVINQKSPILAWEVPAGTPTITQQPSMTEDHYMVNATAAPLTVAAEAPADHIGTLSYQWYSSSDPNADPDSDTSLEGATGTSYTPPTAKGGTSYYYCKVTNDFEGGSAYALSDVVEVKVWTGEAATVPTVAAGQESYTFNQKAKAEISVTVDTSTGNYGTLSYQWYKADGTEIENATEAAYQPPTDKIGSAQYYCKVTNSYEDKAAAAQSALVTVEVTEFKIKSVEDWNNFADQVNSGDDFSERTVKLEADIGTAANPVTKIAGDHLSEGAGKPSHSFAGEFDGQGHSVQVAIDNNDNEVNKPVYAGLFGYVRGKKDVVATVKNLQIAGTVKSIKSNVGGLAGQVEYAEIENVGVSAEVESSAASGSVGVLAGQASNGVKVTGCATRGSATAATADKVGAMFGAISGGTNTIKDCYTTASASGKDYVASIAGFVQTTAKVNMENVYAASAIKHTDDKYSGAFVGMLDSTATLSTNNCYYDSTLAGDLPAIKDGKAPETGLVGKTTEELRASDMPATLGSAFKADFADTPINNGYPILSWETAPAPTAYAISKMEAENGTFAVNADGQEATEAPEGTKLTVVPAPAQGYELDGITVTAADNSSVALDESNAFTMPAQGVTVSVTFKAKTVIPDPEPTPIPDPTPTPTPTPSADQKAADAVASQIAVLPVAPGVSDANAVAAARSAFDALTPDQQKLVSADTLKKLTDAEASVKAAQEKAAADEKAAQEKAAAEQKATADQKAADAVTSQIAALPAQPGVSDAKAVAAARAAYDALTADQQKLVSAGTLTKLTGAESAVKAAQENAAKAQPAKKPAKKVTKVTLGSKKVTAKSVKKALGSHKKTVVTFVLGKNVKSISKKAFKGTSVKTLVIKTTKLSKKSLKGSLKSSKVTVVKIQVKPGASKSAKKLNKEYASKYRPFFAKRVCGKKVQVKVA